MEEKSNWIQTSDPLVTDPDALTLSYKRLMGVQSIKLDSCARQVLTEPSGPWCPTFALARLENLNFFIQILMLGTLDFTVSEHWVLFNFP